MDEKLLEAFMAAVYCQRWEFKEERCRQFLQELERYLQSRSK